MKNKSTLKVATIVGTRPEIIRLSSTIKLLDRYLTQVFIHTGQNYDFELNEIFFSDLNLRKPDYFLEVDTSSVGKVYGETLSKTEEILSAMVSVGWKCPASRHNRICREAV